jgi:trans-L-3-hydroxyproline dehydratase
MKMPVGWELENTLIFSIHMKSPSDYLRNWQAPSGWQNITTIDMHTEGEPLRVIVDGLPEIPGNTILKKRRFFRDHHDHIRTGLMFEPRGHADMYGAVLTEPVNPDSDLGVFFMHNEGYSTMCGHAIIALTRLVLETGLVQKGKNDPLVRFDAPPGTITARASLEDGRIRRTYFRNVPSFVLYENEEISIPEYGLVRFSVAFGGAFYALVEAESIGLSLEERAVNELVAAGRTIKNVIGRELPVHHPFEKDLGFLYGVIFTGSARHPGHHSRNVCIFADGEVDRSPTGSGVSARAAYHYLSGEMKKDEIYTIESIIGTTMDVEIVESVAEGPYPAVVPEVSGTSYITGTHTFVFDPEDPLKNGFLVR